MRKTSLTVVLVLVLALISGCGKNTGLKIDKSRTLAEVQESGKLKAVVGYSATSYFIYRGRPMGYEYELLNRLAQHMNLELEIIIAKDMDNIFSYLSSGKGDIVAHSLTVTKERRETVAFTHSILEVRQMLVQRKPDNWRKMKLHEIEQTLIKNPIDLIGKTVYVRRESAYYQRLENLSEEIGGDIKIVEVEGNISTDELIKKVADGEIDFTIADENIALINRGYYSNIDVGTAISLPQRTAWAVSPKSPELLKTVNEWIDAMKDSTDYYVIYNKYFKNERAFKKRLKSDYFTDGKEGNLSPYDDIIRKNAEKIDWDWRLLASQIYQESHFDPKKKSWVGARGLMQLMPETAKEFGAENVVDPDENIAAGTNYIKWLDDYWKDEIKDTDTRLKFVLASYNVGYNHIRDARNLAEKYKANPDKWEDNVELYLLNKSKKEYYNDEVVNYGYCRGEEPVKYVDEILDRYSHYKQFID